MTETTRDPLAQAREILDQEAQEEREATLIRRFNNGKLSYDDYAMLPKFLKKAYKDRHGRPLSSEEKQAQARKEEKKKRKRKIIKVSRKRNRGR